MQVATSHGASAVHRKYFNIRCSTRVYLERKHYIAVQRRCIEVSSGTSLGLPTDLN